MGKIVFILGGARSGKSTHAIELAKKEKGGVAFIATCQALDREMARRINFHRKTRPKEWRTFEEPYDLPAVLRKITPEFRVILIDCLTLLVSNLMIKGSKAEDIIREIKDILAVLKENKSKAIIISNEVGLGIVPENKLGRDFRDIAGKVNQEVAKECDELFFMVSGIPARIKG